MKNEKSKPAKSQPTREEVLERKVNMAKERNSRVMKISSPLGNVIFNILRQFDTAYNRYLGQLGLPGVMSTEDAAKLVDQAGIMSKEFSDLTQQLCKKIGYRYYTPEELKFYNNQLPDTEMHQNTIAEKNLQRETESA